MMVRAPRQAGFTLIEILMAIAILVVGMTGVVAVFGVAVGTHKRALEDSTIAFLAESLLSDITADFAARDVDLDGTATFTESFIDIACRYKLFDESGTWLAQQGVEAPSAPGFRVEVSIYPLPRRLWPDEALNDSLPDGILGSLPDALDDSQEKRAEEYLFDEWLTANYWDPYISAPLPVDDPTDPLRDLLERAREYKLVVRVIRIENPALPADRIINGEGAHPDVEAFQTILVPGSVVGDVGAGQQ